MAGERGRTRDRKPHNTGTDDEDLHGCSSAFGNRQKPALTNDAAAYPVNRRREQQADEIAVAAFGGARW